MTYDLTTRTTSNEADLRECTHSINDCVNEFTSNKRTSITAFKIDDVTTTRTPQKSGVYEYDNTEGMPNSNSDDQDDEDLRSTSRDSTSGGSPGGGRRLQFYRTKICRWHLKGRCWFGEKCNYAHNDGELRSPPDLSRTRLCDKLQETGVCDLSHCKYAHKVTELRATSDLFKTRVCKYWLEDNCPLGKDCRHAHGVDELRLDNNNLRRPDGSSETTDPESSGKISEYAATARYPAAKENTIPRVVPIDVGSDAEQQQTRNSRCLSQFQSTTADTTTTTGPTSSSSNSASVALAYDTQPTTPSSHGGMSSRPPPRRMGSAPSIAEIKQTLSCFPRVVDDQMAAAAVQTPTAAVLSDHHHQLIRLGSDTMMNFGSYAYWEAQKQNASYGILGPRRNTDLSSARYLPSAVAAGTPPSDHTNIMVMRSSTMPNIADMLVYSGTVLSNTHTGVPFVGQKHFNVIGRPLGTLRAYGTPIMREEVPPPHHHEPTLRQTFFAPCYAAVQLERAATTASVNYTCGPTTNTYNSNNRSSSIGCIQVDQLMIDLQNNIPLKQEQMDNRNSFGSTSDRNIPGLCKRGFEYSFMSEATTIDSPTSQSSMAGKMMVTTPSFLAGDLTEEGGMEPLKRRPGTPQDKSQVTRLWSDMFHMSGSEMSVQQQVPYSTMKSYPAARPTAESIPVCFAADHPPFDGHNSEEYYYD